MSKEITLNKEIYDPILSCLSNHKPKFISQIENEINDIIKILLCIPAAIDNLDIIEELINQILKDDHWNFLLQKENLIFNGNNVDDIIKNFLSLITQTHIQTNQILSVEMKQILNSVLDMISN